MRGKVQNDRAKRTKARITPAYAGKRSISVFQPPAGEDHPRLCGEKFQKNRRSPCYKGSPPPMRGKVFMRVIDSDGEGITPAYAGKRKVVGTSVQRK